MDTPSQVSRTIELPPLDVRAAISSINDEERTVDVVFTTGAGVVRSDWFSGKKWIEKLSLDPAHVRLGRLNDGAPLLDGHSGFSVREDQIGVVQPNSARLLKSEGRATVRFSKRASVDDVFNDVRDGIVRNVSIGYLVHKYLEDDAGENKIPVRTAVDWEPYEISMVPMPADNAAKVRSQDPKSLTHPCVIETRGATPMEREQPEFIAEQRLGLDTSETAAPPEPNDRDRGADSERDRVTGILDACEAARIPRSFARNLIDQKVPLLDAQRQVLDELRKRDADGQGPKPGSGPRIEVGDDPLVHARSGIVNALLHRVAGDRFKLDDNGHRYRGMSVLDIGRAFLHARGIRTTDMSRSDLVDKILFRSAMHTTSDFPSLLEDVAKKNLRSAYEAAPQTWSSLAKPVNLTDFKPSRQLQVGDAPSLSEILEHGEFTSGTIGEAKETLQLKTYGRIFGITRQALINDDLNAFGDVPAAFGRKARDKESDLAWEQITSNPLMGDGVALFNTATHLNLSASSDAISVASLGAGRAALRAQKGIDGVTPLNLSPRWLIVPAAKETIADQFVTVVTPAQSSNANPFQPGGRTPLTVVCEPRLDANSATAWYLACAVDQAPVLYYGTLDGQSGPDLRQQEGYDIDGVKFRCRIDVAFKAADWRAVWKNPGA